MIMGWGGGDGLEAVALVSLGPVVSVLLATRWSGLATVAGP